MASKTSTSEGSLVKAKPAYTEDHKVYTTVQFLEAGINSSESKLSPEDRKNFQAAVESLKKAYDYESICARLKKVWHELIAQGNEYQNQNLHDEAILAFGKAITVDDTKAIAYFNRASVYYLLGCNKLAVEDCLEVLKRDPQYTAAYLLLGSAFAYLEDYQSSLEAFQSAYQLEPTPAHLSNVRVAENRKKEHEDAKKQADMVAKFENRIVNEDIHFWNKVVKEIISFVRAEPKCLQPTHEDAQRQMENIRNILTSHLTTYFMQYSGQSFETCEQYASTSLRKLYTMDPPLVPSIAIYYSDKFKYNVTHPSMFPFVWQGQLPVELQNWASREFKANFLEVDKNDSTNSVKAQSGKSQLSSTTSSSSVSNSNPSRFSFCHITPNANMAPNVNMAPNANTAPNSNMAPNWNMTYIPPNTTVAFNLNTPLHSNMTPNSNIPPNSKMTPNSNMPPNSNMAPNSNMPFDSNIMFNSNMAFNSNLPPNTSMTFNSNLPTNWTWNLPPGINVNSTQKVVSSETMVPILVPDASDSEWSPSNIMALLRQLVKDLLQEQEPTCNNNFASDAAAASRNENSYKTKCNNIDSSFEKNNENNNGNKNNSNNGNNNNNNNGNKNNNNGNNNNGNNNNGNNNNGNNNGDKNNANSSNNSNNFFTFGSNRDGFKWNSSFAFNATTNNNKGDLPFTVHLSSNLDPGASGHGVPPASSSFADTKTHSNTQENIPRHDPSAASFKTKPKGPCSDVEVDVEEKLKHEFTHNMGPVNLKEIKIAMNMNPLLAQMVGSGLSMPTAPTPAPPPPKPPMGAKQPFGPANRCNEAIPLPYGTIRTQPVYVSKDFYEKYYKKDKEEEKKKEVEESLVVAQTAVTTSTITDSMSSVNSNDLVESSPHSSRSVSPRSSHTVDRDSPTKQGSDSDLDYELVEH